MLGSFGPYACGGPILPIEPDALLPAQHSTGKSAAHQVFHGLHVQFACLSARALRAAYLDVDLLVDLLPGGGDELLRVAGIAEELSNAAARSTSSPRR